MCPFVFGNDLMSMQHLRWGYAFYTKDAIIIVFHFMELFEVFLFFMDECAEILDVWQPYAADVRCVAISTPMALHKSAIKIL